MRPASCSSPPSACCYGNFQRTIGTPSLPISLTLGTCGTLLGPTCPPQKCGLRSPSSFCETITIVQTAQIENSSAEMIRSYLSLIPEAFEFVGAHVNVAENAPQRSNFERTVAMHWN